MPERVQLKRVKGYRKPDGAIVVARPTVYGNPFPIEGSWIMWTAVGLGWRGDSAGRRACAVALYRAWLTGEPVVLGPMAASTDGGALEFSDGSVVTMNDHCMGIARFAAGLMGETPTFPEPPSLDELRGHDLACWCRLDLPCHADVLLEVANA